MVCVWLIVRVAGVRVLLNAPTTERPQVCICVSAGSKALSFHCMGTLLGKVTTPERERQQVKQRGEKEKSLNESTGTVEGISSSQQRGGKEKWNFSSFLAARWACGGLRWLCDNLAWLPIKAVYVCVFTCVRSIMGSNIPVCMPDHKIIMLTIPKA